MKPSSKRTFSLGFVILTAVLCTLIGYMIATIMSYQDYTSPLPSISSTTSSSSIQSSSTNQQIQLKPTDQPHQPQLRQSLSIPSLPSINNNDLELQCSSLIQKYGAGNRSESSSRLKSRGEIPYLLNRLGLIGEAVEVGVRDGDYSQWILSHWHGKKYHLVDPWIEQDKGIYQDISNINQEGQNSRFERVKTLMSKFPSRYEIHRDYSVSVAKKLLMQSNNQPIFDFIYLDARHDYDGILEDLEAWWPLLKKGGLYAGHDFVEDGQNSAGLFGVQKAVKEFVTKNNKEVMSISDKDYHGGRKEPRQQVDGGWTTWYFFK